MWGLLRVCQAVAPAMAQRRTGTICNVGSVVSGGVVAPGSSCSVSFVTVLQTSRWGCRSRVVGAGGPGSWCGIEKVAGTVT